jgi:hypothetical protein
MTENKNTDRPENGRITGEITPRNAVEPPFFEVWVH